MKNNTTDIFIYNENFQKTVWNFQSKTNKFNKVAGLSQQWNAAVILQNYRKVRYLF